MNSNGQPTGQSSVPTAAPEGAPRYVVYHDFDGPSELTTTLVHAISDVTGINVSETEFTLSDFVNADALNQLFRPKPDGTLRASGRYQCTIWGCEVNVFSDGQITIQPPTERQIAVGSR